MDGLLFSTEPIYFVCYQKAAAAYGLNFPFELFQTCIGISTEDAARLIDHHFQQRMDVVDFFKRAYDAFEEYIHQGGQVDFRPGAREALSFFAERKYPIAMASSNIRRWVEYLLESKGVKSYFSVIVTAEDVTTPKPNPEIYLTAASRLKVPLENCLSFEDSVAGATAAISAGMRTCVVPQIRQPDSFVKQHAFKIYSSLNDIYPDMAELLN
ncbi:MAG: HAD family phosphatase, partial [Elusimicrobiaceae bacterium]|nr:HAD family phosphatase [Elusimicrobiaceae bacterium]